MATITQRSLQPGTETEDHVPASFALSTTSNTPLPVSSTDKLPARDYDLKEKTLSNESDFGKLVDTDGKEFSVPDYTINDIRKAIPAECFERNATKSLLYIFRDVLSIVVTFCLAHYFITPEYVPQYAARVFLWSVYAFVNGLFGTGMWILAHECGHQTLSDSKVFNDTLGWMMHSALLVPYFSWKITHGKHHKSTGHMQRDMVFVPRTRAGFAKRFGIAFDQLSELTEDAPITSLLFVVARQLFGWNIYLITNDTGHDYHARQGEGLGQNLDGTNKHNGWFKGVNHFSPRSPLFEKRDATYILLSDVGILITASILYYVGRTWGIQSLFLWYFYPYMWVNHWLVAITYLQHTDPSVAHYNAGSWTYVRGAAATIDRDFGFIGHHLLHGITSTHVLHHYVSTIPFYNADKASEAIKPIMGEHYRTSGKESILSFMQKLYDNFRICQWVEPSDGAIGAGKDILFYRNRRGLGVRPIDVREKGKKGLFES